jgi:serine/threonine protein kinase
MASPLKSHSTPDGEATSSRPPIALPEDTRLRDEYRVENVLGMGSFGITYRVQDEHLDTAVAIKEYYPRQIAGRTETSRDPEEAKDLTIQPHTAQSAEEFEDGLQQFMEEGRTIARFDHPNVVDVKSYFEENRTGYLVMAQ